MKVEFIREDFVKVELTRRNLEVLLAKLDDPASARTIVKDEDDSAWPGQVMVTAVENDAHYAARPAGTMYMPTAGVEV